MEPLRPNHPQRLLPPHGAGVAACGGSPRFRCRQGPDASAATPGLSDTHRRSNPSVPPVSSDTHRHSSPSVSLAARSRILHHGPHSPAFHASAPAPSESAAAPSEVRGRTLRETQPHLPGASVPAPSGNRSRTFRDPQPPPEAFVPDPSGTRGRLSPPPLRPLSLAAAHGDKKIPGAYRSGNFSIESHPLRDATALLSQPSGRLQPATCPLRCR